MTLLTRHGCHLCDEAREAVRSATVAVEAVWSEQDVDADPELRAEYGDRVPVVLIDDVEHGWFRIDADRLRAALG